MNTLDWGDLTPEKFLNEYWQKKPLLIKGAFRNFVDPISADELAGLAMEEGLESRIISQSSGVSANNNDSKRGEWQVEHGPFKTFDQFGADNWTLLVQAVNNYSKETHTLLSSFNFIPRWRVDDVMVSFSTPNGGVGAHLDQYDVFIIQGEGKRRWQVGLPDKSLTDLLPHEDLKQVSPFTPIIDETTYAGDLLYIPPNHPHKGVSIENSINFSVGFQSPSSQDLWSSFADKLIDDSAGENRFTDAQRKSTSQPELLSQLDIAALKQFMLAQIDNDQGFNQFIGNYLTQCHHPLEILVPVKPFESTLIMELMTDDEAIFIPVSGIKALIINEDESCLHINGESFALDNDTKGLAHRLAQDSSLTAKDLKSCKDCLKNVQLLTNVLNKGYWYIE